MCSLASLGVHVPWWSRWAPHSIKEASVTMVACRVGGLKGVPIMTLDGLDEQTREVQTSERTVTLESKWFLFGLQVRKSQVCRHRRWSLAKDIT